MHFYENTAEGVIPRHFVPTASRPGESRPTRITDARKKAWYPSVTTIQGLLDKPALTNWKIDEHLKQAWLIYGEKATQDMLEWDIDDFIDAVKRNTQTALDKAPKDGTDFHDVLEQWFTGEADLSDADEEKCLQVSECLLFNVAKPYAKWISEKSFVHTSGFAGKVDLHLEGDEQWVIDFKTKNTAAKWKPGKMAYPEMAQQLAAYRVGLGLHNARCANVFVCIPTGEVEFYEWGPETLDREFANFSDLLRIWLRNAMYVPGKT